MSADPMIVLEGVGKVHEGGLRAVHDVSLSVARGEVLVLVGASGSGKTTLLRMINRLVEPSVGRVRVAGRDVTAVPGPELRRRIGYVIQGNGLFPHRTVAENIATVPELLGWAPARVRARVDTLLATFGMEPGRFRDRRPAQLSGGEAQRVGVARALAAEPPVLLMDEPFGALDPVIRDRAQADLARVQAETGTTVVLVTHDMEEALRLAGRIGVMAAGRLQQLATPAALLTAPATAGVAELLGPGDRALRLLSLGRVEGLVEPGPAEGPAVAASLSLRAALSECLWSSRTALPVVAGDGRRLGRVTRAAIERAGAGPG